MLNNRTQRRILVLASVVAALLGVSGCQTTTPNATMNDDESRRKLIVLDEPRDWGLGATCAGVAYVGQNGQTLSCNDWLHPDTSTNPHPSPSPTFYPGPQPIPKTPPATLPAGANLPLKPRNEGLLELNTDSLYFSPDGNGYFDEIIINVHASPDVGPWELSIDGVGVIRTGQGSLINWRDWDGKVNGRPVLDGHYSFRLRSTKGNIREDIKPLVVDLTPPVISEVSVSDIEQLEASDKLNYTFKVIATDAAPGSSGVDESTVVLASVNTPFRPIESGPGDLPNQYRILSQSKLGDTDTLTYSVRLRDRAGNIAEKESALEADLGFGGIDSRTKNLYSGLGNPSSNLCFTGGSTSYELMLKESWLPATLRWMLAVGAAEPYVWPLIALAGAVIVAEKNRGPQYCYAPVADRKFFNEVDAAEWNTPFVYPFGHSLKYYSGFVVIDRKTRDILIPETNSTLNVKLNYAIVITDQQNKANRVKKVITGRQLGNINLPRNAARGVRFFEWNGYDDQGKPCQTGKYGVSIIIDNGQRLVFNSPFQEYSKSKPPGLAKIPDPQKRIVGIRVINNRDGKVAPFIAATATGVKSAFEYDWKTFIGPAGPPDTSPTVKTHDWHHIVEEHQAQFGPQKIVSTHNLVRLDRVTHEKVSKFYDKYQTDYQDDIPGLTKQPTLREWLKKVKGQDFDFQHRLGLDILKEQYNWDLSKQGD